VGTAQNVPQCRRREGANEAARRAVNAIIDASASSAAYCGVWPLHEPDILAGWRLHDHGRFQKGLAWQSTSHGLEATLGNVLRMLLGLFLTLIHLPETLLQMLWGSTASGAAKSLVVFGIYLFVCGVSFMS
jgi:hypothetical protein